MSAANHNPGSARVSRAGECALAFADFDGVARGGEKFVVAGRNDQHARRARYPEPLSTLNSELSTSS